MHSVCGGPRIFYEITQLFLIIERGASGWEAERQVLCGRKGEGQWIQVGAALSGTRDKPKIYTHTEREDKLHTK
jgi:hypothetical protein